MRKDFKTILITGGAGFIGSHVVRRMVTKYPKTQIVNLDVLTYAGNLDNVSDIANEPNYTFIKGDVTDVSFIKSLFENYNFDAVIHLAAESHVDNSIKNPLGFAETNVMGTLNLLEASRNHWKDDLKKKCFYHISTDEVFGSLGIEGTFTEQTSYDPRSPYSASKASSDHFVRAYFHTYKLPVIISNCSNNYGPSQYPEKLVPLFIKNIVENKPLPVYGKGKNIRDWLYVEDHAEAIDLILQQGKIGETYAIGGNNEIRNIDMVQNLIKVTDRLLGRSEGASLSLISYVTDRLGHDYRYAIDTSKIQKELNWKPSTPYNEGIEKTINFYLKK
ncbi:MAG: dTDP-glucose 4,6-dehydratase [Flavobacteriaceae bacterium]|jgi:dTDP-glucose 4,6-dehydratase|nr:dTDP-glucose 4,6-dehydratase [Flavobacteriaceae bacterium]